MQQNRLDAYVFSINRDGGYAVIKFHLSDQEIQVTLDQLPSSVKIGDKLSLTLEIRVVGQITIIGKPEQGLVC